MKKILVTGSEGLIGNLLCNKLKENYKIIHFDLKLGDNILNKKDLERCVKKCDAVIHLAAESRVVNAYKNPLKAIKYNIIGTANLLESIRLFNPKIFCIYASSREVYGETNTVRKEQDLLKPINVYGVTKLSGELLMKSYEDNYGVESYIVRFSNVYGGLNDHKDRVVPQFLYKAAKNKDITLYGGTQVFDFVHLDDATAGVVNLIKKITNQKPKHKQYHFVTGKGTSLKQLAKIIIKLTKSTSKIKYSSSRPYDVNFFVGDPKLALKDLNWRAKIDFENGIKKYWNVFKKHNV